MMILIIGRSPHLIEAIRSAYPEDEIRIIPWRSNFHEMAVMPCDLIFIVGFDYGSYTKSYEDYIDVNVHQPMLAIQRYAKPSSDIVYVATQNELANYTFSRYRFAKEKLGCALVSQMANSYVVRFDTFVMSDETPLIKGGPLTRLIFRSLVKLGILKTVNMHTAADMLRAYKTACSHDIRNIEGVLIAIPRPQFFDRLMRLVIG